MLLLNAFRIPFEMKDEVLPFGSQRLLVLMVVDKKAEFYYIIQKLAYFFFFFFWFTISLGPIPSGSMTMCEKDKHCPTCCSSHGSFPLRKKERKKKKKVP